MDKEDPADEISPIFVNFNLISGTNIWRWSSAQIRF